MNHFFKKGVKLETKSLRSLNEAYYENDETLKPINYHPLKWVVCSYLPWSSD